MQSLAREVEGRTQRLAEASVARLYEDPFWFARHGEERARRFGYTYRGLLEALEAALARNASVPELPRVTVATGLTALEKEQT